MNIQRPGQMAPLHTDNHSEAVKKFNMLVGKGISKFIKRPIKNKQALKWIEKQKLLKK